MTFMDSGKPDVTRSRRLLLIDTGVLTGHKHEGTITLKLVPSRGTVLHTAKKTRLSSNKMWDSGKEHGSRFAVDVLCN